MKKHIWKIVSAVLAVFCVLLIITVFDAERRVDLLSNKRQELNNKIEEMEREIASLENKGNDSNSLSLEQAESIAIEANNYLISYIEQVNSGHSITEEEFAAIKLMFNQLAVYERMSNTISLETILNGLWGDFGETMYTESELKKQSEVFIGVAIETDRVISEVVISQSNLNNEYSNGNLSDLEYVQGLKENCEVISTYFSDD